MIEFSYEQDYKSKREDGRLVESIAAWTEYLRHSKQLLSLPEELDEKIFLEWKAKVKKTLESMFEVPFFGQQPSPKLISTVKYDGYRTEKWEFYPFDYCAVPVLVKIPDTATPKTKAPIVFCFPGAIHNKEFVAGEPLLDKPAAHCQKFPERNRMGQYMVDNGMVSVTFDPISVGELAMRGEEGDHGIRARNEMIYGLFEYGISYPALSVYQANCFIDFCKTLPYVDAEKIGLAAHSLGTETALPLAILRDDIKVYIHNDLLSNQKERYQAVTETDVSYSNKGSDLAHIMPGKFKYFGYEDLCASLAPMYLALNEGGLDKDLETVAKAYTTMGAIDKLQITHYPKYQDSKTRIHKDENLPTHGLSPETYFEYTNTDAPDHSFRKEPSIRLIKKCFGLEK